VSRRDRPFRKPLRPRPERSLIIWIAIVCGAAIWAVELLFGLSLVSLLPWYQRPQLYGLLTIAIVYGLYRAFAYHPMYDTSYLDWLNRVPWSPLKPLPFGPVLPTWIDAIVIGALALLAAMVDPLRAPSAVFIAAAAAYSAALLPVLSATGHHRHVYMLLALLAWGALLSEIWPVLAVAIAGLAIAGHGARQTLDHLPRGPDYQPESKISLGAMALPCLQASKRGQPVQILGGPYTALAPRDPSPLYSRERAVVFPILIGWLVFAGSVIDVRPPDSQPFTFGGVMLATAAALGRLLLYIAPYWPPLPAARIALRQPIIPRYDIVLVAPVAAIAAAILTFLALEAVQAPPALTNAAPATIALWIVLLAPPTLGRWELTGAHTIILGAVGTTRTPPRPASQ
jgi:hypothetical protein